MKLSDAALLTIMDIFRQGIVEAKDISELLRNLDLVEQDGKLIPAHKVWNQVSPTD